MRFLIDKIIYIYLFICVALLFFNMIYILRSGRVEKQKRTRTKWWAKELAHLKALFQDGQELPRSHLTIMKKRLKKTSELEAYHRALFDQDANEKEITETEKAVGQKTGRELYDWYFTGCRSVFLELAFVYQKKHTMERAFFAYIVAEVFQYGSCSQNSHDRIAEFLLAFLENSTVYCREQVLRALYVLGNVSALEQAFQYISDQGWYHHEKLIADGLLQFRGDKEALVRRFWKERYRWEESLVIGVVSFAANVSEAFQKEFYQALLEKETSVEIRFALMRYFRRYPYPAVGDYLRGLMNDREIPDEYLIVAASVLDAYPGEATKNLLKEALHHKNWYVRRNAAMSLMKLGITKEDRAEITESGDRYAGEMLGYILGEGAAGER